MLQKIKDFFNRKTTEKVAIPTMQLEDFISNSIIQLCNAIQKAQNGLNPISIEEDVKKNYLPFVVPHTLSSSTIPDHRRNLYLIEFDLAITIENKHGTTTECAISVVGFNLKDSNSDHQINTLVSRMKFSIPIIYPSSPNP